MLQVLTSVWALLLGIGLLMVGNGLQVTLLGVRGGIEGFSTLEMSVVMSAYFLGFLGGSRMAPGMIRRVGHVRVFAALASFISAVMVLYPLIAHPAAWVLGRVAIGFCFSGVYVTAESWLNNAASNDNRGKALSLYMIVQVLGIVTAQALVMTGDPSGYQGFVIASIIISISFGPILLSIGPTPPYETVKPMSLQQIMAVSPLGFVGMFLLGGVFSAQFGMGAVYGAEAGLTLGRLSVFVATFYVGALVLQYPLGWLSDRMDRRLLILAAAVVGGAGGVTGMLMGERFGALLVAAFLLGGMANPLYSLLIAHTNDHLEHDDMAAASGGLVFVNGLGAIAGPPITGWLMGDAAFGPAGYFLFMAVLLFALAGYGLYRMTRRPAVPAEDTGAVAPLYPTASPVAVGLIGGYARQADRPAEEAPPSAP